MVIDSRSVFMLQMEVVNASGRKNIETKVNSLTFSVRVSLCFQSKIGLEVVDMDVG